MSICGDRADFVDPDGDTYDVQCSLPQGHAEDHAGRVGWAQSKVDTECTRPRSP